MSMMDGLSAIGYVALRKESVDRNGIGHGLFLLTAARSLSARRAWIEMLRIILTQDLLNGRSPQGERG